MIKVLRTILVPALLFGSAWCAAPAFAQKSEAPPLEQLIDAKPKDPYTRAKLRSELGSLYFRAGEIIYALEEFTTAISVDPKYAPAYSGRGLALFYIQEFVSAEKDFKKALELDPKDPEISNNYGWFLCQTKREKEAQPYFETAYRNPLYRTPELAMLNAGACLARLGEFDQAEDLLNRVLRFSRSNTQANFHLAGISYKRGNFEAAKKQLGEAFAQFEPGPDGLWLLIRVERRLGNKSAETSYAAQLRRKFPDSPEYQALLKGDFE